MGRGNTESDRALSYDGDSGVKFIKITKNYNDFSVEPNMANISAIKVNRRIPCLDKDLPFRIDYRGLRMDANS